MKVYPWIYFYVALVAVRGTGDVSRESGDVDRLPEVGPKEQEDGQDRSQPLRPCQFDVSS